VDQPLLLGRSGPAFEPLDFGASARRPRRPAPFGPICATSDATASRVRASQANSTVPRTTRADGKAVTERSAGDHHQFRFIVVPEDSAELSDLKPSSAI